LFFSIALHEGCFYYVTGRSRVERISKQGGEPAFLAPTDASASAPDLGFDAEHVYVAEYYGENVWAVPR
jgi:hypothetical protein